MDIIVVVCKDADCQYFEIKALGLRLNVFYSYIISGFIRTWMWSLTQNVLKSSCGDEVLFYFFRAGPASFGSLFLGLGLRPKIFS